VGDTIAPFLFAGRFGKMSVMWIAPERRRAKRWTVPVLAVLAGGVLATVLALRDQATDGLIVWSVLAGYGVHLAYRRNEPALPTSEAFGSGHRARSHLRAAAMTGDILVAAIVAGLVVQALRGATVQPYGWLAALAGVTYTLAIMIVGRAP
jgi:hypothetical protein